MKLRAEIALKSKEPVNINKNYQISIGDFNMNSENGRNYQFDFFIAKFGFEFSSDGHLLAFVINDDLNYDPKQWDYDVRKSELNPRFIQNSTFNSIYLNCCSDDGSRTIDMDITDFKIVDLDSIREKYIFLDGFQKCDYKKI